MTRPSAIRARRALAPAALSLLALPLSACGNSTTPSATDATTPALSGNVTVLAAASLTESFDKIKADFEAAYPGISVSTSYGSSATLVQQVNQGAPASVIALAGTNTAEPLDKSIVKDSRIFATNVLEIAVPPSNPGQVKGINDLGHPGLKVVLCAETVPCGKAADATFKKARIVPAVVSREVDVKAALAKVRLAEADAGVVYHSDVVAAKGAITGIEIEAQYNTSLDYPIITLSDDEASKVFVAYVLSGQGLATVQSFGLGAP